VPFLKSYCLSSLLYLLWCLGDSFFCNLNICDKSNETRNTAWWRRMFKKMFSLCDASERDCHRFFHKLLVI